MLLERLPRKTFHNVLAEEFIRWAVLLRIEFKGGIYLLLLLYYT